jgi:DNA-binding MarR family transcriptional regulator
VNDSTKKGKSEVECSKCNRKFKHATIERFLEEEEERELLKYFKGLWNPPKEGKFV